jgi:hypothetical protein
LGLSLRYPDEKQNQRRAWRMSRCNNSSLARVSHHAVTGKPIRLLIVRRLFMLKPQG